MVKLSEQHMGEDVESTQLMMTMMAVPAVEWRKPRVLGMWSSQPAVQTMLTWMLRRTSLVVEAAGKGFIVFSNKQQLQRLQQCLHHLVSLTPDHVPTALSSANEPSCASSCDSSLSAMVAWQRCCSVRLCS